MRKRNIFVNRSKLKKVGTVVSVMKQGVDACRNLKPWETIKCPYPDGTKEADLWLNGYINEKTRRERNNTTDQFIKLNPAQTEIYQELMKVPEPVKKQPKRNKKDLEGAVLKECLEYLHKLGIFCWRNNVGAFQLSDRYIKFGIKGAPDIIGVLKNGIILTVECKRRIGGKQSVDQKMFQYRIEQNNGVYLLVKSAVELEIKLKGLKI